ncbi:sugar phosphate isomerase/epimerase family protein [Streptomyces chrestomyceticus]|uniref:Sugar phosphate isomerase/epimerase family protein n=1 Tax=Streptomyces chrestomyceticus TaxID=68185 RepID=A0ABU7WM20_9ACTN
MTATNRLRLAYGTNGLTDLRLTDALALLSDLGYDGVALTLDHMHLDPLAPDLASRTAQLAHCLDAFGLSAAVETGARYVLDPRRKHHPTLLDPDPDARTARIELLRTAVRVAADLGATAVHCFSGPRPAGTPEPVAWQRLADALTPVLDAAATARIPLAVEPEPGHLLSDLAGFHRLRATLDAPPADILGLTLDIGHCQCLEPEPPAACVRAVAPWLRHVQIEDMRRGVHEHLPFGAGEIDFPPVLAALRDTGYQGLVSVELPRHSHAGPDLARTSLSFLRATEPAHTTTGAGIHIDTGPPSPARTLEPAGITAPPHPSAPSAGGPRC